MRASHELVNAIEMAELCPQGESTAKG